MAAIAPLTARATALSDKRLVPTVPVLVSHWTVEY